MAKGKYAEHWPIIAVVIVVAVIFIISLVTFQVQNTEYAIVMRFGEPKRVVESGLRFQAPWPIESVWRVSNRIQYFEGDTGKIEEVYTADKKNINITTYILFKVANGPEETRRFMQSTGNLTEARKVLTSLVRTHRNAVIGQYNFSDMITTETLADGSPAVKLDEIEGKILERVQGEALERYGITVTSVGFKHIGLPESVTQRVFERMRADRERVVTEITRQGQYEAERIRQQANKEYSEIVEKANSEAMSIKSQGDAEAAKLYATFNENPELAAFLARLQSLSEMSKESEMTIIVDPSIPPFDIFKPDALERLRDAAGNAPTSTTKNP